MIAHRSSEGTEPTSHPTKNTWGVAPVSHPIIRLALNHFPSQFCAQLQSNRVCFSDMTISGGVEGERMYFNAHRVMLAAHSKFLGSLFLDIGRSTECVCGDLSLIITDFSASVVSKLVQLIYTGTCTLPSDHEKIELASIMAVLGIHTGERRVSDVRPQLATNLLQQAQNSNGQVMQKNGVYETSGMHTVEKPNTAVIANCSTATLSRVPCDDGVMQSSSVRATIGIHTGENRDETTSDIPPNVSINVQQQQATDGLLAVQRGSCSIANAHMREAETSATENNTVTLNGQQSNVSASAIQSQALTPPNHSKNGNLSKTTRLSSYSKTGDMFQCSLCDYTNRCSSNTKRHVLKHQRNSKSPKFNGGGARESALSNAAVDSERGEEEYSSIGDPVIEQNGGGAAERDGTESSVTGNCDELIEQSEEIIVSSFVCSFCPTFKTTDIDELQRHLWTHVNANENNEEEPSFNSEAPVKHNESIDEEETHERETYQQSFEIVSRSSCKHNETFNAEETYQPSLEVVNHFSCSICGAEFESDVVMVMHINEKHGKWCVPLRRCDELCELIIVRRSKPQTHPGEKPHANSNEIPRTHSGEKLHANSKASAALLREPHTKGNEKNSTFVSEMNSATLHNHELEELPENDSKDINRVDDEQADENALTADEKQEMLNYVQSLREDNFPFSQYVCKYCYRQVTILDSLRRHIRQVHLGLRPFPCRLCTLKFFWKSKLVRHMWRKHHHRNGEDRLTVMDGSETGNSSVTQNKRDLSENIKPPRIGLQVKAKTDESDENGKTVLKIIDPFKVTNYDAVQQYVQSLKRDTFPDSNFTCKYCNRRLITLSVLRRHIRQTHLGLRPFSCQQCSLKFSEKRNLNRHMRSIRHGNCTKTVEKKGLTVISGTVRASSSVIHKGQTEAWKPPKMCLSSAGMKFKEDEGNNNQEISPLKVSQPSQSTKIMGKVQQKRNTASVRSTQRTSEMKAKNKLISSANKEKRSVSEMRAYVDTLAITSHPIISHGPYICKYCQMKFAASRQLRRHILSIHIGERFKCQFCDKAYARDDYRLLHQRKIHSPGNGEHKRKKLTLNEGSGCKNWPLNGENAESGQIKCENLSATIDENDSRLSRAQQQAVVGAARSVLTPKIIKLDAHDISPSTCRF